MSDLRRFQVAHSNLIHDTIEGEVILLNLETGTYYQLTHNGVPIWNALVQGYPVLEIQAQFSQQYPNEGDAIARGIEQFVQDLEREGLLKPLDHTPSHAQPLSFPLASKENGTFIAPVLLKYTDMQSLLLLDPVHDVDSQGWPILKPNDPPV